MEALASRLGVRSCPTLLPPLPSSERSDLGAPYAPWPEADALDGPAPDETDSPIDDDSTAGEMLLDAITGAARAAGARLASRAVRAICGHVRRARRTCRLSPKSETLAR